MPLINCKIKLKLKWTNHWVLARLGVNKANVNDNNIFIIKDTNLYVPVITLPAKNNQKYENFLAKDLKDQFIGMNIKKKWEW